MALRRARTGGPRGSALEMKEVLVGRNRNCFQGRNTHSDNLEDKERQREGDAQAKEHGRKDRRAF